MRFFRGRFIELSLGHALYRYLVDDFVIQFCQGLKERDFIFKSESVSRKRKSKREYLNDAETKRSRDYGFEIRKHVLVLKHFSLSLNKRFPDYFHIW